jgi:hypothetical protein
MLTFIKRVFNVLFGGEMQQSKCNQNCNQGRTCDCKVK